MNAEDQAEIAHSAARDAVPYPKKWEPAQYVVSTSEVHQQNINSSLGEVSVLWTFINATTYSYNTSILFLSQNFELYVHLALAQIHCINSICF